MRNLICPITSIDSQIKLKDSQIKLNDQWNSEYLITSKDLSCKAFELIRINWHSTANKNSWRLVTCSIYLSSIGSTGSDAALCLGSGSALCVTLDTNSIGAGSALCVTSSKDLQKWDEKYYQVNCILQ